MTKREELIAEFAFKCCEKGDNIQMMWHKLRQYFLSEGETEHHGHD
jgi:hypothetical protein